MKKVNYVKVKSQHNLTRSTEDIPVKSLNAHELKKCRKILEQDGEKYTDEEIEIIYNYLSEMAEISVSEYLKTNNYEESNSNVKG
jgi:hypothetical protein